jgi:hypothetical protein
MSIRALTEELRSTLTERDYPEAHPAAVKLRDLIGKGVGGPLNDAMELALDAASTESDHKKKARLMHIADTLKMAESLLKKKVWNDLQPLLDPSFL